MVWYGLMHMFINALNAKRQSQPDTSRNDSCNCHVVDTDCAVQLINLMNAIFGRLLELCKFLSLQCFDAVGWAAWRASGLWWGVGVVICLERGADLHTAPLMPLPLTVSCFSKIQIGFTFLVPAHLNSPGKRAVKRVCVCVCAVYVCRLLN